MTAYRRSAGVSEMVVEADLYLVAPGSADIFHLDSLAASLWRLLQAPTTEAALAAVMADAFPDADSTAIAGDVARALAALGDQGLIEVVALSQG